MRSLLFFLFLGPSLDAQPIRDLRLNPLPLRAALVMGNDAYPASPLKNPGNDARLMADALKEVGFQTTLVLNGTLRDMDNAVTRFTAQLAGGDVALIYYAGHGIEIEGENYLIPVDFNASSETDAKYAAYPAARAQEKVERSGAAIGLLILDACRNNPFRASRSSGGGLAAMNSGRGTFIAFATGPGKTADDNPEGANGLFTMELAFAMKQPGLSLDQVFNRVRAAVYERSSRRQLPWTVSSLIGEFQFRGNDSPQSAMNSLAPKPSLYDRPPLRQPSPINTEPQPRPSSSIEQPPLAASVPDLSFLTNLASAQLKAQQFDAFEQTASQIISLGGKLTILLNHHHTLTGLHPASVTISNSKIAFDSMGASECNQKSFEVPVADLVSANRVALPNSQILLALRIRGEKNKVRLLHFADSLSYVDTTGSLPIVRSSSPAITSQVLQSVANVFRSSAGTIALR